MRGADTLAGGYAMMCELIDRPGPRPTAALIYNDLTAIGALRALDERGLRVPDDMAIIGTDGIDLGSLHELRRSRRSTIRAMELGRRRSRGAVRPAGWPPTT